MERINRVVFVGHDNEGSSRLFGMITEAFPDLEFLLIISKGLYYKKTFPQSALKLLKEASWLFIAHRLFELIKYKVWGQSLKNRAHKRKIPIFYSDDINAESTLARIKAFKPDLMVSLFTMQIYKQPIIDLPKFGSITSHPSILPHYRGLEVFFWVLANNEEKTGVSVFFLDEKIDAGKVFRQKQIDLHPETTSSSLYREITEIGGELLIQAIEDIDGNSVSFIKYEGKGSYFGMPDRAAMRRYLKSGRKL